MMLSEDISQEDYAKFASMYPELAQIGRNYVGPKIWILFNALRDNSVSVTSISHKPCASLMENDVSFEDINNILSELSQNGLLLNAPPNAYRLKNEVAYVLQKLSFDLTRKLPTSTREIYNLLKDCGYSSAFSTRDVSDSLLSDDNNVKTSKFKELMSEVAFSGLRLIIKLMNRAEESIN